MNDQHIINELYLKIILKSFLHDFIFIIKRINKNSKKLHV